MRMRSSSRSDPAVLAVGIALVLASVVVGFRAGLNAERVRPAAALPNICTLMRPQLLDLLVPGRDGFTAAESPVDYARTVECVVSRSGAQSNDRLQLRVFVAHIGRGEDGAPYEQTVADYRDQIPLAPMSIGLTGLGDQAHYLVETPYPSTYVVVRSGLYLVSVHYENPMVDPNRLVDGARLAAQEVLSVL